MRSRYSAFAVGDVDYLARTWHVSTRPEPLTLDPTLRWTGLHVVGTTRGGLLDSEGEVEFVARWENADGRRGRHHERSTFVREPGGWLYVDALA